MDLWYFIDSDIISNDDLPAGVRVMSFPVGLLLKEPTAEGPFYSIEAVKSSKLFKQLQKENPKRAKKILEPEYLPDELVDLPSHENDVYEEYKNIIFNILTHSIVGKVSKSVSGIHLETPYNDKVRIINESKPDKKGVWKAELEVFNVNSDKWVKKPLTTFFPKGWSTTRLISECEFAYMNRVQTGDMRYQSFTRSGIPVILIIDDSLKTIYPLFAD